MRLRIRLPPPSLPLLALLLFTLVISTVLAEPLAPPKDPSTLRPRDLDPDSDPAGATPAADASKPRAAVVDAPVDGVDGKPHAGPFVGTSPERGGSKNSLDESPPAAADDDNNNNHNDNNNPPTTKEPPSEPNSKGGGVMDDPNRPGPKEGTRGTEGGISEKSKSGQDNVEKKPDSPKDPPPLPHSEQQKIPHGADSGVGGDTEKEKSEKDVSKKEEKVLQVSLFVMDVGSGFLIFGMVET